MYHYNKNMMETKKEKELKRTKDNMTKAIRNVHRKPSSQTKLAP